MYTIEDCIRDIGEPPFCECGCGNKINVKPDKKGSYAYYKRNGYPKFINGHHNRGKCGKLSPNFGNRRVFRTKESIIAELGEPPLCACRCGQKVNIIIYKYSEYKKQGYPKFIKGHARKLNIDEKNICDMYEDGLSSNKIAKEFGVSRPYICNILRKNNIKIKTNSESHKGLSVGENNPMFGRTGKLCWIYGIKGKDHPRYGKPPNHSKKIFLHLTPFQGVKKMFRWDYLYALYLESIGEPYFYEGGYMEMKIEGRNTSYTPDFSLPLKREFVEIKGWMRPEAKLKCDKFKEELNDEELMGIFGYKVLFQDDLKKLGIKI